MCPRPRREDDERAEALALHEGAGDQRGRDDGEGHLEGHEQHGRDRLAGPGRQADALEPDVLQAADEPALAGAEAERVTEQDPLQADEGDRAEAVHERRQHVLAPHQSSVEQAERRRHEQHHGGRDEHPGRVGSDVGIHRTSPSAGTAG